MHSFLKMKKKPLDMYKSNEAGSFNPGETASNTGIKVETKMDPYGSYGYEKWQGSHIEDAPTKSSGKTGWKEICRKAAVHEIYTTSKK